MSLTTTLHKAISRLQNHGVVSGASYATAAARRAQTGLTSADVGRIVEQTDTDPSSFWMIIKVTGGVGTYSRVDQGAEVTFSGDFGALFNTNGLTVDGYWRGDLGLSKTGSIVNSWANQLGTYGSIAEGSAGVGIATASTDVGRATLSANGSTQYGAVLDNPQRPAPATTNVHYYVVYQTPVSTPGAQAHLWGQSGFQQPLFHNASDQLSMYAGTSLVTTAAAAGTWIRARASFTGSTAANTDEIKWGSSAAVFGNAGNNAGGAGASHGLFATESGTNKIACKLALLVIVRGPKANFLTQAAIADTNGASWFTGVQF